MTHKATYQELEQELNKYKVIDLLLEKSPIVNFIWKNEEGWPVENVSENVKNILGYSKNDFMSANVLYEDIIHEQDIERVVSEVAINSRTNDSFEHMPYRIINKNGQIRWIKDITIIIRNIENEVTHYQGIITDITQQKLIEYELKLRENYLIALNKTTEILSEDDPKNQIQKVIEIIGAVAQASRTYVFKNHTNEKGELLLSQIAEHVAEGIKPEIGNPELQNISYSNWLPRWYNALSKGDIINGKVADFPQIERVLLDPQEIKAILIIPIIAENEFWGFIGFDNCINDEGWQSVGIEYLKASAERISAKIVRNRKQELLRNKNKRFYTIMNSIDAVVYVADMQTHELLFLNEKAKKLWGDKVGGKCYSSLQKGKTEVCEFCTNHLLLDKNGEPNKPHVWEFKNTITEQWFQCRDQAIKWVDGRLVRIEIATDITNAKDAENALRESEQKYKTIFENAPLGIVTFDLEGNILSANKSLIKALGAPSIEASKEINILKLKNIEETCFKEDFFKCIKNKQIIRNEDNYTTVWGKKTYIKYYLSPILDIYDNISSIECIFEDITIQEEAQKELAKLSKAVEQSANSIIITDIDGIIEYVNPKFTELTGYSAEESIGQNPKILSSDHHTKEYYSKMWKTILKGSTWKGEFCNKTKNGTIYWEATTITAVTDNENNIINFIAIKEDVTKVRISAEELKESEKRFKILSKATYEGIIISKDGVIIDANQAAIKLSKKSYSGFIGKSLIDFVSKEYKQTVMNNVNNKYEKSYEVESVTVNGITLNLEIQGKNYTKNGESYRITAVRDISERKKTQKELEATKDNLFNLVLEAEEKERTRISQDLHDGIGPNLSSIRLHLNIIEDTELKQDRIKLINKTYGILAKTVSNLKSISKALSPYLLNDFGLDSATKDYIEDVNPSKINITYNSNIRGIRFLNKIEMSIFRIIKEFINNSIKYSKCSNIYIDLMYNNGKLFIRYSDNGIGFNVDEVLSRSDNYSHYGIRNIITRINNLKGKIEITSSNKETNINIEIKLKTI